MPVIANSEAIWVIIIIVSVIAQIVNAAKKATTRQAQGRGHKYPIQTLNAASVENKNDVEDGQQEIVPPADALQEFLRNLAGESVPPRPPVTTARPPIDARYDRQPVRVIKPPAYFPERPAPQMFAPPSPEAKPVIQETAPPVTLDDTPRKPPRAGSLAEELKRELRDCKNLRKAILLREIIERPPLALR